MKKYVVCTLLLALMLSVVMTAFPVGATMGTKSTSYPESADDIVKTFGSDVLLTAGKDTSCLNLTWSSTGTEPDKVQWIETSKLTDGAMPNGCYSALSTKESGIRGATARVQLTELKPDTEYSYRLISSNGTTSSLYSFKTRAEDNSFSFLFAGDPQIGASGTDNDYAWWAKTLDKAAEWFGDDIEFLMTAGDQVNEHNYVRQYNGFAVNDWLRSHTLITTVGNHDDGYGYSQYYTYTDVDQSTTSEAGSHGGDFWVDYDGVLIISLNVNDTSMARHKAFMERAIAEYTELHGDPIWTIVTFHFSIYTGGARAGEFASWRNTLGVYMSELGVDAVLSGHDHVYTRAYMINGTDVIDGSDSYVPVGNDAYGSYHDPKEGDIFYLTANSSSGSKFYDLYDGYLPYAAVTNQESIPNITKVDVTPDSLVFTTYRTSATNEIGDVMDFFAIHRSTDKDIYAPSLNVPSLSYYNVGDKIDLFEGISSYDNVDGDLADKITVEGAIDITQPVTLTYRVTDNAGNIAEKQRTFIPLDTQHAISAKETVWKYLDDGSDIYGRTDDRESWKTLEFDDSSWKQGKSAFSAVAGQAADIGGIPTTTLIEQYYPVGSDEEGSNIPCYFFRTTFDLRDIERINRITGKVYYNDACWIFINGVRVSKLNVATVNDGDITYNGNHAPGEAAALGSIDITDPAVIASLNLKEKDNVVAVMLYQFDSEEEGNILFHFDNLSFSADGAQFPFTDVKPKHWYYDAVTRAYAGGLFVGTSDTKFSPNGSMTRAMTWAVLSRIAGEDIGASEGAWYKGYQSWAIESGTSDGKRPNDKITREQLVSMLHRMQGNPEVNCDLSSFADHNKISDWAKASVMWAVDSGLMVGKGERLAPRDNATRAEASVLLLKYLEIK